MRSGMETRRRARSAWGAIDVEIGLHEIDHGDSASNDVADRAVDVEIRLHEIDHGDAH